MMKQEMIYGVNNVEKKSLLSIQLLRIIACLGVFCVHLGQRTELTGRIRTITDFGRYGVYLFFIICGFLAAKGLDNRRVTIGKYYVKRAIHILPLYYFSLIWYFITENILNVFLNHIPSDPTGLGWLRYLFFLNGFVNSDTYFWSNLGITWTIPIFVVFYLLAPILLRNMKSFQSACIVSGAVIILTKYILYSYYQCTVLADLWVFFLGVIAYYALENKYAIPVAICFQGLAVAMIVFEKTHDAYGFLFTSITILLVLIEEKLCLPQKLKKCVDYIDQRTYTMYLVHGIVFCSLIDRLWCFGTPFWVRGILAIGLSLLGTVLVYRFYELPVQKWLLKKVKERGL